MYGVHDWAEVHRLYQREHLSKSAIARRLGMSRPTVIATAHEWVGRLGAAKRAGRLDQELEPGFDRR